MKAEGGIMKSRRGVIPCSLTGDGSRRLRSRHARGLTKFFEDRHRGRGIAKPASVAQAETAGSISPKCRVPRSPRRLPSPSIRWFSRIANPQSLIPPFPPCKSSRFPASKNRRLTPTPGIGWRPARRCGAGRGSPPGGDITARRGRGCSSWASSITPSSLSRRPRGSSTTPAPAAASFAPWARGKSAPITSASSAGPTLRNRDRNSGRFSRAHRGQQSLHAGVGHAPTRRR